MTRVEKHAAAKLPRKFLTSSGHTVQVVDVTARDTVLRVVVFVSKPDGTDVTPSDLNPMLFVNPPTMVRGSDGKAKEDVVSAFKEMVTGSLPQWLR